jgi:hypothetical protein
MELIAFALYAGQEAVDSYYIQNNATMEKLWCWRCKMELAMLDEEEYRIAYELYAKGMRNRTDASRMERFRELLDFYYTVTGEVETEPNAIMHHRIAQYGPPCEECGLSSIRESRES